MSINNLDAAWLALKSGRMLPVNKASIATQIAGGFTSLWRATGLPAQGAIPAAAANCNNTTLGGFRFTDPSAGIDSIVGLAALATGIAGTSIIIEDRLMHMGGLNGTLITAQTVNLDASVTTDNMALRIGASDYSNVEWWLEWYTATGATGVNATVAVTYNDNSTGNIVIALAASVAAARRLPILPVLSAAVKGIKSVQSVTLSATTGTAGSFGVTATRALTSFSMDVANRIQPVDPIALAAAKVENSACLALSILCITTSSGTIVGHLKMGQA